MERHYDEDITKSEYVLKMLHFITININVQTNAHCSPGKGQCYKTLCLSLASFSSLLVGKAGPYPDEVSFTRSTLG
jgi:hypothetical protein